jgi:hypothetical protein
MTKHVNLSKCIKLCYRSQWPCGLRTRSEATWLLGSRFRIPLMSWMFVSCACMFCCSVQVEASVTDWSLVQRSLTVCLYVCDQETPKREAKGPSWTISACEWMNDRLSKAVLPCVLIRLRNLSMWGGQGPYKDCRATDDYDNDDD